MLADNQSNVIAFLNKLLTSPGTEVELISTHASLIFLAGDRAYKLKRAVQYPYLDLSTPEKRFASCEAEVELNRRTAPSVPWCGTITRESDGSLVLGGTGYWSMRSLRCDGSNKTLCSTPWPGMAPFHPSS